MNKPNVSVNPTGEESPDSAVQTSRRMHGALTRKVDAERARAADQRAAQQERNAGFKRRRSE